jgi:hypothetical protein
MQASLNEPSYLLLLFFLKKFELAEVARLARLTQGIFYSEPSQA